MSTPSETLIRIEGISYQIKLMQQKFDSGELKGHEAALQLQRLKRQRQLLQADIKPALAWSHPFPEILPAALKRTPEEVREMLGIVESNENS